MGAGGSKSQVHVHLDRPFFYTGEMVTGCAVIHITEAVKINNATLKLTGVEKTSWSEGSGQHTRHYRDKHVIFKVKQILLPGQELVPGSYQIPFSFLLPAGIPGSFRFGQGRGSCSIEYKAKAYVDITNWMATDLKYTAKFNVLQRTTVAAAAIQSVKEEPLSFFCCFNKGMLRVSATVPTNSYLPGHQVQVAVQVDNRSTVVIPEVRVAVKQKVQLAAATLFGQAHWHASSTKTFGKLTAVSGGGQPGAVSQYTGTLQLPNDIEASASCKLITSRYLLEVNVPTSCCISEVTLKEPLLVNDPEPAATGPAVQLPPGWAPQTLPGVTVALPAPAGYPAAFESKGMPPPPPQSGYIPAYAPGSPAAAPGYSPSPQSMLSANSGYGTQQGSYSQPPPAGYQQPAPGYPQPAPAGYPQQPQGYPQPAPGYPQSPPAYQQPPAGCVQPPPGYAQSPPPFGAPAPGYPAM